MSKKALASALLLVAASQVEASSLVGITALNELVRFDSASPTFYTSSVPITGTNGNTITDLTYDFDSGTIYGLDLNGSLYNVSLTGAATLVNNLALTSFDAGFAYDPSTNSLAFGGASAGEFKTFSTTGASLLSSSLSYATGDSNTGTTSTVALAIDPIFFETFFIDDSTNSLGRILDPNFQEGFTVGPIGFDVTGLAALTIDEDGNLFGALSTDGLSTDLYSINSTTGAASLVGNLSGDGVVSLTAIPEPSSTLLVVISSALLGFSRRRSY